MGALHKDATRTSRRSAAAEGKVLQELIGSFGFGPQIKVGLRHATGHSRHVLLQICSAAELNLEGDFKKTKLKLTWLAQSEECPQLDLVVSCAQVAAVCCSLLVVAACCNSQQHVPAAGPGGAPLLPPCIAAAPFPRCGSCC